MPKRLASLLGRIRDGARKTLDAIQSNAFGIRDVVFPVCLKDLNAAVSYLVEKRLSHEEARQLRCEYEQACHAARDLQLSMWPPIVVNYPASDDDPDDPEVARVEQANAGRRADHQRNVNEQRRFAIHAFSALLNHVEDLAEAVESTFRSDDRKPLAADPAHDGTKVRRVAEKTERQIENAIQALPPGSTQEEVAEETELSDRTVRESKAWKKRWGTWGVQKHSSDNCDDDPDTRLDIQEFIEAKTNLLHHKTRKRVERFMADDGRRYHLIAALIEVEKDLEAGDQSLRDLSDDKVKATIRSVAEQVWEATRKQGESDKSPA